MTDYAVKHALAEWHGRWVEMERERDEWKARAETAEHYAQAVSASNRDNADRASRAERERDEARADRDHYRDSLGATVTERDEWKARAEAAEARLADPYSQANQDAAAWDRVAAHPALRMDLLPDVEGSYADCVFERITQLAEVAEAVTEMKPAVAAEARTVITREDVTRAVRRGHNMLNAEVGVVNEMCDLLGIEARQATDPDPVEVAIRRGLTVWGVTDKAVQEIAASVRHVLGQEASDGR